MTLRPIWFVLLVVGFVSGCSPTSQTTAPPRVGERAPDFALAQLDGSTVRLADLQGQVVIVNFWATWCAPCAEETPRLVGWYDAHHADGLQIVGVDALSRDSRAKVDEFVSEYKVSYPILLDETGDVAKQWLAQQLPRTYVVDREGMVRFARIGGFTDEDFQQQVMPLLQ